MGGADADADTPRQAARAAAAAAPRPPARPPPPPRRPLGAKKAEEVQGWTAINRLTARAFKAQTGLT